MVNLLARLLRRPCLTCQQAQKDREWLEKWLGEAGFKPIRHPTGLKYDELELKRNSYKDWERHGTYGDFLGMMATVRQGLYNQLVRGTVDQHGISHDTEKRACIYILDTILGYIPNIYQDYDRMKAEVDKAKDKARAKGMSIHGTDEMIRHELDKL